MLGFNFHSYNLLFSLLISFLVQALFFILAAAYRTDKFTDLAYGLGFILTSLTVLVWEKAFSPVQLALFLMVLVWGLRLAIYLFIRILKTGRDKRFDEIRNRFLKFALFWLLQAFSIWVISLPVTVGLSLEGELKLNLLSLTGIFIWLFGLIIEALADYQKFVFKSQPANQGKWIGTGLWAYSRHPNYFGEIVCWWGVFLTVLPFLRGFLYLSALSPFYITLLILFVSGLPPLERRYDRKYKDNQAYQEYKKETSILIPWPFKKAKA